MTAARKTDDADEEYMSLNQAAKEIGRAAATVLHLVIKQELKGKTIAGRTFITIESVNDYKARNAPDVPTSRRATARVR